MKGLFITFEGTEGSGKTTLIDKIENRLNSMGYKVVKTREPGGIKIAEQIRNVILDVNNTKMDKITEALLYAASRRQHLVERYYQILKKDILSSAIDSLILHLHIKDMLEESELIRFIR